MSEPRPTTILCLASYEKGADFLRACKAQGCRVLFVTTESLREADWPWESIDEVFYMPDLTNRHDVLNALAYLARGEEIARIVPLDEFDHEMAATVREHLRLPGTGESAVRFVRDKLAMRLRAAQAGLPVPDFTPLFSYDRLRAFMDRVPPPWVLKPRTEASAIGIRKHHAAEEVWRSLDELGDKQSHFLLERFVPGSVFHVDAVVRSGDLVFAEAHRYTSPPFEVMHGGGLFCSQTLPRESDEAGTLKAQARAVAAALGLANGVCHTEFIQAQDGRFYFLELAARVGGAHIADMVEAATGVNLWAEWAKLEVAAARGEAYEPPTPRQDYAGVLISLAKQEWPDLSAYSESEIVWRMHKRNHAGLIVRAERPERVRELLDGYMRRFFSDFHTSMPAPDKATH